MTGKRQYAKCFLKSVPIVAIIDNARKLFIRELFESLSRCRALFQRAGENVLSGEQMLKLAKAVSVSIMLATVATTAIAKGVQPIPY